MIARRPQAHLTQMTRTKTLIFNAGAALSLMAPHGHAALPPEIVPLLNKTALIRYCHVAQPGSLSYLNGKALEGWTFYEASIQADTWWVLNTTNSTPGGGAVRPGCYAGASFTKGWTIERGRILECVKSTVANEHPQLIAEWARNGVLNALSLGIFAKEGSFLEGRNSTFTALDIEGAKLSGKFTDFDAKGRPAKCSFTTSSYPAWLTTVDYVYGPGVVPISYARKVFVKSELMNQTDFMILACNLGAADVPAAGFTPDMFLPGAPRWTFTNDVAYAEGKPVSAPDLFAPTHKPPSPNLPWWFFALFLIVAFVPPAIVFYRKSRSNQ